MSSVISERNVEGVLLTVKRKEGGEGTARQISQGVQNYGMKSRVAEKVFRKN